MPEQPVVEPVPEARLAEVAARTAAVRVSSSSPSVVGRTAVVGDAAVTGESLPAPGAGASSIST